MAKMNVRITEGYEEEHPEKGKPPDPPAGGPAGKNMDAFGIAVLGAILLTILVLVAIQLVVLTG